MKKNDIENSYTTNLKECANLYKNGSHDFFEPVEKLKRMVSLTENLYKKPLMSGNSVGLDYENTVSSPLVKKAFDSVISYSNYDNFKKFQSKSTSIISFDKQKTDYYQIKMTPYTENLERSKNNVLVALDERISREKFKTQNLLNQFKSKKQRFKLSKILSGHLGIVRCLDIHKSNEFLVSGASDNFIKFWNLASGIMMLTLVGHKHSLRSLKFDENLPHLFSAAEDKDIKCWDLNRNRIVRNFHGHKAGVYSLSLDSKFSLIYSGSKDKTVRVWDARVQDEIFRFQEHTGSVSTLISQSIEPQLISGGEDRLICIWDLRAGKIRKTLTHHAKSVRSLFFHQNYNLFVSAGADDCKVWSGDSLNFLYNLENVDEIINSITIKTNKDSSWVIGGSDTGHIYIWDLETGKLDSKISPTETRNSLSFEKSIYSLCLDRSETRLITGEQNKNIRIWAETKTIEEST